ncbi:MAG: sensor histidine kinase, partial [Acidimicrobiales bacterium]
APLAQAGDVAQRIAAGNLAARADEAQAAAGGAEIESLTRSLNAMADSLERSRGLEQQFLLSISHDLRTPLTSIRGYAEAILDGALDEPQHGARVIRSEAARLERLVADLLELARLEARQFGLSPAPLDLARLAADGAAGFAPAAEAAGRRITVRAEPTWVLADRDRLAQVIANLVENALRFAASQVEVRAGPGPDGMGWLQVADDGPGIAAEDLPHVFERLYVARSRPRRKESGSGLGLAIVRELVAAMGGVVHAEAPPGGGARLVVRLPAVPTPPTAGGSGG